MRNIKVEIFKIILIFISVLLSGNNLFSQEIEKEKGKDLYKFSENLKTVEGNFTIGVLGGSNTLMKSLKKYQEKDKNFKPFYIQSAKDVSDRDINIDAIYVGPSVSKDDIAFLYRECEIKNFVVITDSYEEKLEIMINFYESKGKLKYQVNTRNLQKLGIKNVSGLTKGLSDDDVIDNKDFENLADNKYKDAMEELRKKEHELRLVEINLNAQKDKIRLQKLKINEQTENISKAAAEILKQKVDIERNRSKSAALLRKINAAKRASDEAQRAAKDAELKSEKFKQQAISDSIKNAEESARKAKELEEINKKIEDKNREMADLGITIKTQQNLIWIFIGVFVVILALAFFLFRSYRTQKKQNKLLAAQKDEIENQALQLEDANKELAKLSVVASETSNAVAILDKKGNFEWVNSGFTRMYGFTLQLLFNEMGTSVTNVSSHPEIRNYIKKCIEEKSSISYENEVKTREGKKKWAQTTISPTLDEQGKPDRLVMIDTDITEIKKAEAEIAKRNDEIKSSILYAKRIQHAVLTPKEVIAEFIPEHFIMFRPRDIVSGDFYWASEKSNKLIVAAADCTGHGVPGAFMSMLGIAFLNQIIAENRNIEISSNFILDELRKKVKTSLNQTGKEGEAKDGMDIALCIIDKEAMTVDFAGAQNPLILVRNGEFEEHKGDHMPIGISYNEEPFKSNKIQLKKGDHLYIFSDGYADQFNGKTKKKFFSKRLKMLLADISKLDAKKQQEKLESTFDEWKGTFRQMDDVLIIGMKI